jgi:predicted permease
MIDALQSSMRQAWRALWTRPLTSLLVVVTLAVGIGATSAMYALFAQLVLRPLPVPEPAQLVNLVDHGERDGEVHANVGGGRESVFSYPLYLDLAAAAEGVQGIAAHRSAEANLSWRGATRSGRAMAVSGNYFEVLGLKPALGRLLAPGDDRVPNQAEAVVLAHDYWRDAFGGRDDVLGQTLSVNGRALAIVGVAPARFAGTTLGVRPLVYVPISMPDPGAAAAVPSAFERRDVHWLYLFARLAPGHDAARTEALLGARYRALLEQREWPLQSDQSAESRERFFAKRLLLVPGARGQSRVPERAGLPATLLFVLTVIVLATACANIANLLLAQGSARLGEMALRASLGASSARLRTQVLAEAGLLALLGALAALPVAAMTLRGMAAILPTQAVAGIDVGLSPMLVAVALVTGVATALLFGLFPAWQVSRTTPQQAMREQSAQALGGRGSGRLRQALATAQIAVSLALLVLAGLFATSLWHAERIDTGLPVAQLTVFGIAPERSGYDAERAEELYRRISEELAALPGVDAVGTAEVGLFSGSNMQSNVAVEGYAGDPRASFASVNVVGPGFVRALGLTLLAGREFTAADTADTTPVALVNRKFAERFGLGAEAVGKRMSRGQGGPLDLHIVGLVADVGYSEVKGDVPPQFWLARTQSPGGRQTFYVASRLPSAQVMAAVRARLAAIDADLPIEALQPFSAQLADNLANDRMVGMLSAAFALVATLLAATGLFGVLSYSVAQRRREIALRLALGAAPARLSRMVFAQVLRMTAIGGSLGLGLALALGRGAESLLFGVGGSDPTIHVLAMAVLLATVFGAAWWPARRAARVQPVQALRGE